MRFGHSLIHSICHLSSNEHTQGGHFLYVCDIKCSVTVSIFLSCASEIMPECYNKGRQAADGQTSFFFHPLVAIQTFIAIFNRLFYQKVILFRRRKVYSVSLSLTCTSQNYSFCVCVWKALKLPFESFIQIPAFLIILYFEV